jgi:Spy/CpxP family protein refolding chaperone
MGNRMTHRTAAIALATVLLAAAPLAGQAPPPPGVAQPPSGPPQGPMRGMRSAMRSLGGDFMLNEGPGMMLPLMLRHADLTSDQDKRVREIMEADRERLHALLGQLDAVNYALAAKLTAPGPVDAAALKADVEQVAHLRQELMDQGLKTALAVRAVLTPEQLAKVAAVQTKLRTLQGEMRELLDGK